MRLDVESLEEPDPSIACTLEPCFSNATNEPELVASFSDSRLPVLPPPSPLLSNATLYYSYSYSVPLTTSDFLNGSAPAIDAASELWSNVQTVVLLLLAAVLAIATVGGNLLTLISFYVERQLRTTTNYFIVSLAVADFTVRSIAIDTYQLLIL